MITNNVYVNITVHITYRINLMCSVITCLEMFILQLRLKV